MKEYIQNLPDSFYKLMENFPLSLIALLVIMWVVKIMIESDLRK